MPVSLTPQSPPGISGLTNFGPPTAPPFGQPTPPADAEGVPWARYIDVLRRHVLLVVGIAVIGSVVGVFAARRIQPVYDVQGTVWIASGIAPQSGPIRPQQLLPPTSWVELLRSYAIIEPVVRRLKLNVFYKQASDSIYFTRFESLPSIRSGGYVLKVDTLGRYLLTNAKGIPIERGAVGDSIGRKLGFAWAPEPRFLSRGRIIPFWVTTPRNASTALLATLRSSLPDDGQFMTITLSGSDPERTTRTLNAWIDQFVASSGDLKKRHLLEFKKILSDQLSVAETQLRDSESQLERFRVSNITLPSGAPSSVGGGAAAAPDASISGYFQQKGTLAEVHAERIALEQLMANARGGPLDPQAFLMLPSILNNTPQLRAAIEELSSRQASIRTEQQFLTDANPRIKQLNETVRTLQYETIPQIVQSVAQSLRAREQDLGSRLETQSSELRAIPSRTIEEMRLVRQVSASENLYSVLKARYEEVSLAEAQTTPDLSVLDYALPPLHPNSNDAPRLVLLAILASIGAGMGLSLLHDRIDRRFRYPEQATHELGLTIAGTVPRLRPSRSGEFQVDLMSQMVESFRTLRLAMRYDFPTGPVVLTVSSPSSSDGKSLVSSNLALAFASSGHRTLLIDGDVRRGALHSTFDVQVTPGLVEYLCHGVSAESVVKSTSSENLFILPRGTRANRAPELLVSPQMSALIDLARKKFDVVIIDSPPFVAGVDAYALSAVTGNILVVLRQGMSDRKLAAAKLAILDRLPVRILGAVLNGVPDGGLYRYYGTDYAQGGSLKNPVGSLATPRGLVVGG